MTEYNNQCLTVRQTELNKPCKVNTVFNLGTATPGESYTVLIKPPVPLHPRRVEVTADGAGLVSFQIGAALVEWLLPFTSYYFLLLKDGIPQDFTADGLTANAARVKFGPCEQTDPLTVTFATPNPCHTC
jgi:hypothetical protein